MTSPKRAVITNQFSAVMIAIYLPGAAILLNRHLGNPIATWAAALLGLAVFVVVVRTSRREPVVMFEATEQTLSIRTLPREPLRSIAWTQLKEVRWDPRYRALIFKGAGQELELFPQLDNDSAVRMRELLERKRPSLKLGVWD